MPESDKQAINTAVKNTIDWLALNPSASVTEIGQQKQKLEDELSRVNKGKATSTPKVEEVD